MTVDSHIYMKKDKVDIEISLNEFMIMVDQFIKVSDSKKVQFKV